MNEQESTIEYGRTLGYLVAFEHGANGSWSAYADDVPGVFAAGATREEVEHLMREAIPFHLGTDEEDAPTVPSASA